jgi:hypothetical protein
MVRYKFKLGNKPASHAPRMRRVAYKPPTVWMKPEKMVVNDQTMHRVVSRTRGVSFFRSRAAGVSKVT